MPPPTPPSIRTVLVAAMLTVALVPAALVGLVGVHSITRSVRSEAQSRVDQDLEIVRTAYADQLAHLAYSLEVSAHRVGRDGHPPEALASLRQALGLTVLNLCDAEGRPLAGSHAATAQLVPLGQDPVLRQALLGRPAWGTVSLDPERLRLEGGPALEQAAALGEGGAGPATRSALMWWVAVPLRGESGRVAALLYGGRLLNFDAELVDQLRDTVFSEADYGGKPRGTVTLFAGDVRVATNVLAANGERAVGTRVSEAVRRTVLEQGRSYTGEALVVDAWYLSAYSPLRDPAGRTIGMVYVGLLRAPYDDLRSRLIGQFLQPVALVGGLAVWAALYIANRITRPLRALSHSASKLAEGDWEHAHDIPGSYLELESLAGDYADMRLAIQ